jgi:hypothetical protein
MKSLEDQFAEAGSAFLLEQTAIFRGSWAVTFETWPICRRDQANLRTD